MANRTQYRHFFRFCLLIAIALYAGIASAQDSALNVQQTAEYDIGFGCPVVSTLDPVDEILWVLMDNCFGLRFTLHGFHIADGSPANADTDLFAPALEPLEDWRVYADTQPMAFMPDGTLEILYTETEAADTRRLRLPFYSEEGLNDSIILTWDKLGEVIPGFEGYPDETVYNKDHSLAAVLDTTSLHVIDLQTGMDILQIDLSPDAFGSFPSFSADSQLLYVATFNNTDDVDNYSATLRTYSLPSGDALETNSVPSAFLRISPNGQYAAATYGDSQNESETLIVIELASGRASAPIEVFEAPRRVLECLNRESDLSDVDIVTSGRLPIRDITWLADSSGFFTVNSYQGESSGGGAACYWNYSRLRRYAVG